MLADEVTSRDAPLVPVIGERQRPHACVSIKNLVAGQFRLGNQPVRFAQEIVDFLLFDLHMIEVAFISNIGCADEVTAAPGNDEEWPAVCLRFRVQRAGRRSGKLCYDQMASFRPANQSR